MLDSFKTANILPKLKDGSYTSYMKLVSNSLRFDLSDPAKFRLKVLTYYYKYGWKATIDAYGIGKSTLYDWKKLFERSKRKNSSLIPRSTRPYNLRIMTTDIRLVEFIKSVRMQYGNVSKYKLKVFVDEYAKEIGSKSLSISVIGKLIKRCNFFFEGKAKVKRRPKLLYPRLKRHPREKLPGYIEMDSITIYIASTRYYFITAIDIVTKFAWAKLTTHLSSAASTNALGEFRGKYTPELRVMQTDNGHEFMGKFDLYLLREGIKHEFIYPRSPKINGVIERFNRSLQEEFIQREASSLNDPTEFNQRLATYLIWYNTKRPHQALNYMTPTKYLENLTAFPKCM